MSVSSDGDPSPPDRVQPRAYHGVMVSSTFRDLQQHRGVLSKALAGQSVHPVAMEQDSALPAGTVVDSSLHKVRDAAAYIGIIGHSYGQIPDTDANPQRLSLTELEFRAARHLGHPMLIFLLGENHPVRKADVEQDPEKIPKLAAFRNEVKRAAENSPLHRVYREFDGLHEFEVAATQAIAELRRHLDQLAAAVPTRPIRRPSAYLRQVQRIAPPELVGRDDELAELTTFCLAPDPAPAPDTDRPDAECARIEQQYRWWRAPAWSGKSALMSTFVLHPPAALRGRVRIVSFFITARLAAQDTHTAFATTLVQQLADLLGQDPPSALTETDRDEHLLDLLDQAAHSCNAWVSGWCWSWTDSTKTAV